MEILGLFVVILLGSVFGSGLALWRDSRAKPTTKADPFVDARYGRIASEFDISDIQAA